MNIKASNTAYYSTPLGGIEFFATHTFMSLNIGREHVLKWKELNCGEIHI
jgi:hypothetical protein